MGSSEWSTSRTHASSANSSDTRKRRFRGRASSRGHCERLGFRRLGLGRGHLGHETGPGGRSSPRVGPDTRCLHSPPFSLPSRVGARPRTPVPGAAAGLRREFSPARPPGLGGGHCALGFVDALAHEPCGGSPVQGYKGESPREPTMLVASQRFRSRAFVGVEQSSRLELPGKPPLAIQSTRTWRRINRYRKMSQHRGLRPRSPRSRQGVVPQDRAGRDWQESRAGTRRSGTARSPGTVPADTPRSPE